MAKQKNLLQLFILSIFISIAFSCGEKKTETKNDKPIENPVVYEKPKTTAYKMMEVAFEGYPSTSEIKPMMEKVMKDYNFEVNEKNLERVADMLVTLRKESLVGVTEMEILKDIYQKGNRNISLPNQAALSFMNLEDTK